MHKFALLFIFLALAGCAGLRTPAATPIPVVVRTVSGDQLPEGFPAYPAIDLGDRSQWQGLDALLISQELLYQAREDETLRGLLQDVAWEMVLLVSGASPRDLKEILNMPHPITTTTTTRYVLVALRATQMNIVSGGILVDKDKGIPTDIARDIDKYVRGIQEQLKEQGEKGE